MGNLSPGSQVIALLLLLHPFGSQDDEDRVLMQEMVDQNTADLIVVPLFLFRPVFALGLIKLTDHFQTFFVAVVTQPVFEEGLVEVKPLDGVMLGVLVLLEEFGDEMPRLVLLLDEAENLVDFVGDNVTILVDLILRSIFSISLQLGQVLLICLPFRNLLLASIQLLLRIS